MSFNLIDEAWIPVRRQSGMRSSIAPWQLTEGLSKDPAIALDSCRADFNGALVQMLIGLVQQAMWPRDEEAWEDLREAPPDPDELRKAFAPMREAFHLDSGSRRFFQDPTVAEADSVPIQWMLIGAPGDLTLKDNRDLFIKRQESMALCRACAAQALLTLQVNGPAGGAGYRQSLRGKGPLTTVLLGEHLWGTVWLNVLPRDSDWGSKAASPATAAKIFPWMGPIRTSAKDEKTTPSDGHPLQAFWSTSHRTLLASAEDHQECGACGATGLAVRQYWREPYGTNYHGAWRHPLSPFLTGGDSKKKSIGAETKNDATAYRHWMGVVIPGAWRDQEMRPAPVVEHYRTHKRGSGPARRLWAFGYWMKPAAKAKAWVEGTMPVVTVDRGREAAFDALVIQLVRSADEASFLLVKAVAKASDPAKTPSLVNTRIDGVRDLFWSGTEGAFYRHLERIASGQEHNDAVRSSWHEVLKEHTLRSFDAHTGGVPIGLTNAGRVVRARRDLRIQIQHGKPAKTLGLAAAPSQAKPVQEAS